MTDLERVFRNHPFVATLSDAHIAAFESCEPTYVTFEPGDKIVREGQVGDACYLIEEGEVGLDFYVSGRGSHPTQIVHGGEVVGWSWFFPPYRGVLDATALTPVTALRIDAAVLRDKMETDPAFGYAMLVRLGRVAVSRLDASRRELIDSHEKKVADPTERPKHPGDLSRTG